jgi:hypothetical protein
LSEQESQRDRKLSASEKSSQAGILAGRGIFQTLLEFSCNHKDKTYFLRKISGKNWMGCGKSV